MIIYLILAFTITVVFVTMYMVSSEMRVKVRQELIVAQREVIDGQHELLLDMLEQVQGIEIANDVRARIANMNEKHGF